MSNHFKIKTQVFEGPLDLLLTLVEKRKLTINDISLAQVTDEYIKHVEGMPTTDISARAEFILVASTLLLIKSRSLLPSIPLTDDEQMSVEDLEMRLKILQVIREGSESIKNHFGKNIIFGAEKSGIKTPVFSPHKSITLDAIKLSLESIMNRFPKKVELKKALVQKVMSLEEMMDKLTKKIQSGLSLSFKGFAGHKAENKEQKVEVIVSFLAMLELVKQGILDVIQDNHFDDIKMETTESLGVPRY
ncbi:MAG: segregation/condensation protein A [Patescibacteria group bacterium]